MKRISNKTFIIISILIWVCSHTAANNQSRLDSLYHLLETTRHDTSKVNILVEISRIHEKSDLSLSLQYSQQALEIAEKTGNKGSVAYALFNLGNVSFAQGLFPIAVNYFEKYIELQHGIENAIPIAFAQINLGAINIKLNQFEQAEKYFLGALESFRQAESADPSKSFDKESINIYNNLGIIYQREKDVNKAIEYYNKGIELAEKTSEESGIHAMLFNNLSSVLLDMNKTEEALVPMEKALEIRLKNNDRAGEASSYKMIARYHSILNNKQKTREYLNKAFSIAEETGNNSLKAEICNDIFNYYQLNNQSDSALKYHILLKELNDIMNKDEALKELTRIELTAQFEQQDLIRQAEQKRKELKYLIIGLVLFLSVVILTLLYFLLWSRMKRLRLEKENVQLVSKNLELEKTTLGQELEIRNKELTTNVMHQIQRNELVNEVVQKLQDFGKTLRKEDQHLILGFVSGLKKSQNTAVWNEFEVRFQQVHNEYYDKLNLINPDLTPNDRRLCAFLRLNMNTKEIASITGQSIRSIEVARTRLRRKLNLTNSDTGLVEFLSQL
ncbi:MAG: tetratricopeptide repeat protein [Bacteroidales bacterium]